MKYFKRQLEEGATEYFEEKDDLSVVRSVVVGKDGNPKSAAPPRELLKEDFSLTEIEAAEFSGTTGQAK